VVSARVECAADQYMALTLPNNFCYLSGTKVPAVELSFPEAKVPALY